MMFADQNMPYASSQTSGGDSTNYSSFSSTFSDNNSYATSRRESFQSDSLEDAPFVDYGNSASSFSMPAMTNNTMAGLANMQIQLECNKMPVDPGYGFFNLESFMAPQFDPYHQGSHLLPTNPPSLVSDLNSPLSDLAPSQDDFINPSQTFIEGYDTHSPASVIKYNSSSPISDYTCANSPGTTMSYMSSFGDDIKSCSSTPSRSSPLRQPLFDQPLETSAALQRVQSEPRERRIHKRMKRESANLLGNTLRIQNRAMKKCPWEGCDRKFQRQEHLKRHEKTHTRTEWFPCEFCNKLFNRSDNLKSHVGLHANPNKKSARTTYFPGAIEAYAQMSRKPRKNQDSSNIKAELDTPARSRVSGY